MQGDKMKRLISMEEISKHNKESDCWIVVHGKVYDVTNFLSEHPGGSKIILNFAGKDATPGFEPVHNRDIVAVLPEESCLGEVDPTTITKEDMASKEEVKEIVQSDKEPSTKEVVPQQQQIKEWRKPPIDHMLNTFDFESVAKNQMKKEGWDYYSSGGDDEITLEENHAAFLRIWLRPRVLVNVGSIDMSTKMLGSPCSFPVYITATALGKLAHPEGEVVLTRAAFNEGVIQMCPTLASCSLDEMMAARQPGQVQWFQLYVNRNRKLTKEIVERAEKNGIKGLFITVDAPQLGRRERDMRNKFVDSAPDVQKKNQPNINRKQGTARAISAFIDPTLCWDDIAWFKSITKMPIILKGIQTGEDAILAAQHGVQGIVVSNHGGRQLDTARSGIEILPEVMDALKSIGAEKQLEVFVDGGIRRGTDIFKALALGAKGVGIGRPALYGLASYGQEGVERTIQLLKDELEMCMRLMGTPTISHIKREMVITDSLTNHSFPVVPSKF